MFYVLIVLKKHYSEQTHWYYLWSKPKDTEVNSSITLLFSCRIHMSGMWTIYTCKKIDSALNACCRQITGCLRPTPTSDKLYIFWSALPHWYEARCVASMKERKRQVEDIRHPLFNQTLAANRLASRERFLKSINPLTRLSSNNMRVAMWDERFSSLMPATPMVLKPSEELPTGEETR